MLSSSLLIDGQHPLEQGDTHMVNLNEPEHEDYLTHNNLPPVDDQDPAQDGDNTMPMTDSMSITYKLIIRFLNKAGTSL